MAATHPFRFRYRDRTYRASIATSRVDEATWELEALQIRFLGRTVDFLHGEFESIMQAFEAVYKYRQPLDWTTRTRLRWQYRRRPLQMTIPAELFFHATFQVLELFLQPAVRRETLEPSVLEQQMKTALIIGSPWTPAIWAFRRLWLLPDSVQRPCWQFQTLMPYFCSPHWTAEAATCTSFGFFWDACVTFLQGTDAFCPLRYPCLGRTWSLSVASSDIVEAAFQIVVSAHAATTDSDFDTAYTALRARFNQRTPIVVPVASQFNVLGQNYFDHPAAMEPEPYGLMDVPTGPGPGLAHGTLKHWCRLCHYQTNEASEFAQHLTEEHDGPELYRLHCLQDFANAWPAPTSPQEIRACIASYADSFHDACASPGSYCGSCAAADPTVPLQLEDLRAPPFQLQSLHDLLSARAYISTQTEPIGPSRADFAGLTFDVLEPFTVSCPLLTNGLPCASPLTDAWILFVSASEKTSWSTAAADPLAPLLLPLCQKCKEYLASAPPRLPPAALANGNLALPLPPPLRDLTIAEQTFIARGHNLIRLHTLPGRSQPEDRQSSLRGNVISFPQNAGTVFASLPRPLANAPEMLTVLFTRDSQADLSRCPEFRVRRQVVHDALLWLRAHNPFYADIQLDTVALNQLPIDGIPPSVAIETNVPHSAPEQGAADAQVSASTVDLPLGAAVLDTEGEDILPPDMWRRALAGPPTEGPDDFAVVLPHADRPLSSSEPAYWTWCFPALFPYGDSLPKTRRRTFLPFSSWARALLLRQDRSTDMAPWALDLHFIAALFSVMHRKDLLQAIRAKVSTPGFARHAHDLRKISATDFELVAGLIGEAGSLRQALRTSSLFNALQKFFI